MLKKISNSLSTDNSLPIFGYSINEVGITSASFFCVITLLYKVVFCPPLLCPTSQFTDKAAAFVALPSDRQSELIDLFIIVRSVQLLGCRSKRNITCAKGAVLPPRIKSRVQISLFCIRNEQFGRGRGQKGQICTRAISLSGPQQAQACCNLTCFHDMYWAVITMVGKPDSGMARLSQGASQAEFLREGIFRCRAGVGGQGSRAAMESP